jgi:heavy metal sensor kinase
MKFRIINSLRLKLTLWYGLVVGIIILVSGILLYGSMRKSLLNDVDTSLFDTVHEVEHSITNSPESEWSQIAQKAGEKFQLSPPFVQVMKVTSETSFNFRLAARSKTLIESGIKLPVKVSKMQFLFKTKKTYLILESEELSKYALRILYYPVLRDNAPAYIILSATSMHGTFNTLQRLIITLLVSGPLILFLISIGGYFMIKRAMRPVKAAVHTARKISAEDLSHRIRVKDSSGEIGELIETFNGLIARLEGYVNHIKRFTSDVSHELRTPLTVIRGEIEVTLMKARNKTEYEKVMRSVLEEAMRLEHIIDNLLFISRMEAQSKTIPMQEISMDKLLLHAFERWEPTAKRNGLQVTLKKLDTFTIAGNETLLNRLILNLLENAVKFTPESGEVEIALVKRERTCVLTVKDTGFGIPAESLPHIFERFYRVDKARSRKDGGSGLGLAIVKHVAEIHGASVDVQSQIDKGTLFTVTLPLHPPLQNPEH